MATKYIKGLIKFDSKKVYGKFRIEGSFVLCNPTKVEELILKDKFEEKISFREHLFRGRWKWVWKDVPKRQWNFFKIIPEHLIEEIVILEETKND